MTATVRSVTFHRAALSQAAQLQAGADTVEATDRHTTALWLLWALDNPGDVRPSDLARHTAVVDGWVAHLNDTRTRATITAVPERARVLATRVEALQWAIGEVTR